MMVLSFSDSIDCWYVYLIKVITIGNWFIPINTIVYPNLIFTFTRGSTNDSISFDTVVVHVPDEPACVAGVQVEAPESKM